MREKRTFAERTKVLKSDEVRKQYFLIYEVFSKHRKDVVTVASR